MDHMNEAQIIDLIAGDGAPEDRAHLEACAECRAVEQRWIERVDALREIGREQLDEAEMHRLRVLFRQLGPGPGRVVKWVAKLVRSSASAPATATARGVASGEIMDFSAGRYSLMLRVGARGSRQAVSVVGQVVCEEDDCAVGGMFALTPPDGRVRLSDVDRFGEFQLTDVAPGTYRGTWWFEDQLMVVPEVEIGTDDER